MGNQVSRKVKSSGSKAGSVDSSSSIQEDQSKFLSTLYPLNTEEAKRQQSLHYLLKHVFQTSIFAPVEEQIKQVDSIALDIGCGLYVPWVADIAHEYPNCTVHGLDNVEIGGFKIPDNATLIKGDLFVGLPFPDSSVDFVHQRMMKAVISVSDIPNVLEDIYRIIKPGGWLEILEPQVAPRRAGPLMTKLFVHILVLLETNLGGKSLMGDSSVRDLKEAGFQQIKTDYGSVPICWGGYMGKIFYDYLVSILKNMGPLIYEHVGLPGVYNPEKYEDHIDKAFDECVEYQTYFDFYWTIGQKPEDSPL
ncbi:hypothetical protein K501DRAFT_249031 [Backusella circina FSU 941]|nr:hypothetical protein K501DRAFT_249031 [Backusella circina FSU 941]